MLCLLEQSAVAIYHAAQTHLESLNALQRNFVSELGLSEAEAFLEHKLAPLALRRDIAALGLLHKIQLGEAPPDFNGLFFFFCFTETPIHTATNAREQIVAAHDRSHLLGELT